MTLPAAHSTQLQLYSTNCPNAAYPPQPKVADCSAIERLDRWAVRDIRALRACWQLRV